MNYYLGMDVSKGYCDFVILNRQKKVKLENFQLDDTNKGHRKLEQIIRSFLKKHPKSKIYAGLESTGNYSKNWLTFLKKLENHYPLKSSLLNPLGINANTKAALCRNITDPISAKNIAKYLIEHSEKIDYKARNIFYELKNLARYISFLENQLRKSINFFKDSLYTANPEILNFCSSQLPNWVLELLSKYPTAKSLSKVSPNKLAKIKYISLEKAKKIIKRAKNSVGSDNNKFAEISIRNLAQRIKDLKKQIKDYTKLLIDSAVKKQKNLKHQMDLLCSFKGIAKKSAIFILLEIGSIACFPSSKHIASYFGLHPVIKRSGDGSKVVHMSKKGRAKVRAVLFNVVRVAIQHNPLIKKLYKKFLNKGKVKMSAIGACMHKTLRIIYGMLKNNSKFDPKIDRKNRNKSIQNNKKNYIIEINNNRRFQKLDDSAPISNRNRKKRKKWKIMSQNDETPLYTGSKSSTN